MNVELIDVIAISTGQEEGTELGLACLIFIFGNLLRRSRIGSSSVGVEGEFFGIDVLIVAVRHYNGIHKSLLG